MLPKPIQRVIDEFSRLPGIGPKSAQRIAMYLLRNPESRSQALGDAFLKMRDGISFCDQCWNLCDDITCNICSNPQRDHSQICVVEEVLDVVAIERTGEFKGVYHVLHGALSPINGITADHLKIAALFERVKNSDKLKEVILATNPGLEGEATAMYLMNHLKDLDSSITRIARGLPIGANLEYADQVTLTRALEGRQAY